MSSRTVNCVKLKEELPGLSSAPFDGELGEKIYQSVSEAAWKSWEDDMMIKVINEYRLNLADKEDYNTLLSQMCAFLGLSSDQVAEVENPERGA